MSVFSGLKSVVGGLVDVVMVIPDALADATFQEWHEEGVESRTKKRLKRAARRVATGGYDMYRNSDDELVDLQREFRE